MRRGRTARTAFAFGAYKVVITQSRWLTRSALLRASVHRRCLLDAASAVCTHPADEHVVRPNTSGVPQAISTECMGVAYGTRSIAAISPEGIAEGIALNSFIVAMVLLLPLPYLLKEIL